MKIIATFAVGLALAGVLSAAPAQAQAVRTFVSPTGVDTAACSLTAPCRTFAAAYAVTNAGGEISVLGTAGYGTLTINKAISIVNGGGFEAGIAVPSGGVGITIGATTSDAVSLRGLTIDGAGVGQTGILFNSGKSLFVENCIIRHMTASGDGIDFFSTAATSALIVSNSLVSDNNNGILLQPTGSATAVFNGVEINNNAGFGILVNAMNSAVTNKINATVNNSVATGNGQGYSATAQSGQAPTNLLILRSLAANNGGYGTLSTGPSATIRLANSALTGNANGWVGSGGTVDSYGDNYIDGNVANETAPPGIARK